MARCSNDQVAGFADGHEKTNHVRMRIDYLDFLSLCRLRSRAPGPRSFSSFDRHSLESSADFFERLIADRRAAFRVSYPLSIFLNLSLGEAHTSSQRDEVEMVVHACEEQGADMQLEHEFAGENKCSEFLGRQQLEIDADLGRRPV